MAATSKKIKGNKSKPSKKKKPAAKEPQARNPVVLIAKMRNSAGPMTPKNERRQRGRKSWKKQVERDMLG